MFEELAAQAGSSIGLGTREDVRTFHVHIQDLWLIAQLDSSCRNKIDGQEPRREPNAQTFQSSESFHIHNYTVV